MQLSRLYDVIETVNSVGITEVRIQNESDGTIVSGIDKENTVVVSSKIERGVVEENVGIHRVPAFIQRLKLFDLDNTKVSSTIKSEFIRSINVSEGRKKSTIVFADPNRIRAPWVEQPANGNIEVSLQKQNVDYVIQAISSMDVNYVTFKGESDALIMELKEKDTSDSFETTIGENDGTFWQESFASKTFVKLLKLASKDAEEVSISISSEGTCKFVVDDIDFLLIRQTVE